MKALSDTILGRALGLLGAMICKTLQIPHFGPFRNHDRGAGEIFERFRVIPLAHVFVAEQQGFRTGRLATGEQEQRRPKKAKGVDRSPVFLGQHRTWW